MSNYFLIYYVNQSYGSKYNIDSNSDPDRQAISIRIWIFLNINSNWPKKRHRHWACSHYSPQNLSYDIGKCSSFYSERNYWIKFTSVLVRTLYNSSAVHLNVSKELSVDVSNLSPTLTALDPLIVLPAMFWTSFFAIFCKH